MTTTTLRLQQRKGTASQWSTSNPILGDGEFGYDVTNNILKIGKSSTAWSSLPSFLTTTGGTLTGALTLSGAPSSNLHAATKQYVDTKIADLVNSAPGTLDTLGEIATALTSTATGSILDSIAAKLPLAGGTMTGLLTLSGTPSSNLHAATKQYVDTRTYTLDDLTTVTLTSPTDGQYLTYNYATSQWKNTTLDLSGYQPAGSYLTSSTGVTTVNGSSGAISNIATTVSNTFTGTQTLAAGSTSLAPLKLQTGTNLTTVTAGAIEYDGTVTTLTSNTSIGRAPISTPIFTSGVGTSGTTATTNYALFPSANDTISLPIGTYKIETSFQVASTSTTASTLLFSIKGSGNAVGTMTWDGTSSITLGSASNEYQVAATALTSAITVTASSSVARAYVVRGSGILKITTAGTIIPSYQFSGAVGGTTTLYAENYLVITPLSSSGTAVSTGAWA